MPTIRQKTISEILHAYPFYRGRRFIKFLAQSLLMTSEKADEIVWAKLKNGRYVRTSLADFNGQLAYYYGSGNDVKIDWICQRLVRPGDIVLDVGANIGTVTFTLSALVGDTGRVHCFEPNPQMQHCIEDSIQYNGAENITLHPFALGEQESTLELTYLKNHSGSGSLVAKYEGDLVNKIKVPIKPLSTVLSEWGISQIRLVKIDVEGFEPQVLRGAYEAFAVNPPDAIIIELRPQDLGSQIYHHPTIKILQQLGYDFFCIPKQGWTTIRPKYFDPEKSKYLGTDLLASPRGKKFDEIASLVGASV
ncbi:MAG: FkbM family methyltransferase [Pleurocapsa sp.]